MLQGHCRLWSRRGVSRTPLPGAETVSDGWQEERGGGRGPVLAEAPCTPFRKPESAGITAGRREGGAYSRKQIGNMRKMRSKSGEIW